MAVKTVKIRKNEGDPTPSVSASWRLDVNVKGDFSITEYALDYFTSDELVTFAESIEKGEITEEIVEYLGDDISDTIWHNIKETLTLEIDTDEFRKWIKWAAEKDKEAKNG